MVQALQLWKYVLLFLSFFFHVFIQWGSDGVYNWSLVKHGLLLLIFLTQFLYELLHVFAINCHLSRRYSVWFLKIYFCPHCFGCRLWLISVDIVRAFSIIRPYRKTLSIKMKLTSWWDSFFDAYWRSHLFLSIHCIFKGGIHLFCQILIPLRRLNFILFGNLTQFKWNIWTISVIMVDTWCSIGILI